MLLKTNNSTVALIPIKCKHLVVFAQPFPHDSAMCAGPSGTPRDAAGNPEAFIKGRNMYYLDPNLATGRREVEGSSRVRWACVERRFFRYLCPWGTGQVGVVGAFGGAAPCF